MKFCWTTITVKNMAESLKFYREIVGLPLVRQVAGGPGPELAFLGAGETQVELICHPAKPETNIGPDIALGFVVQSLDDTMAFVKDQGIEIQAGPYQPNPFIRFFYVLDPNGLKIQFVENIKAGAEK